MTECFEWINNINFNKHTKYKCIAQSIDYLYLDMAGSTSQQTVRTKWILRVTKSINHAFYVAGIWRQEIQLHCKWFNYFGKLCSTLSNLVTKLQKFIMSYIKLMFSPINLPEKNTVWSFLINLSRYFNASCNTTWCYFRFDNKMT